jgi:glycosyltransferase involved in cell wall biosynthesis
MPAIKRVLMIAYHFPPLAGSSGIQRTLRFVQHLPAFGWEPIVLTTHPRAYEQTSDDLMDEVPPSIHVERAFALDAARHLAIGSRYPAIVARPDRWIAWRFGAVPAGMRLIRKYRPQAIWSTFPIATAHVIGEALQRRAALPWIADFRDPMAQEGYPTDPRVWRSFKTIEETVSRYARFSVFTTPGAARDWKTRYPEQGSRTVVIENGYDEESFAGLAGAGRAREPLNPGAVTVLHSGIVYPSERDPTWLFAALARLVDEQRLVRGKFKIRFRAAVHDELLRTLAQQHRLGDFVEVLPPIGYRAALEEMVRAEALLILQAANCNEQIPAKIYEYLRAGQPILALTDAQGDTAGILREAGIDSIARLDSEDEIVALLGRFVSAQGDGSLHAVAHSDYVARASRTMRAGELAGLLNRASADF